MYIPAVAENEDFLPAYANPGDAGADLKSSVTTTVYAGQRLTVPTGVSVAIPKGHVGFITPRSGLAARYGITVLNTPGTIDSGYRGELKVILYNTTDTDYWIEEGDRIGQLVIVPFVHAHFTPVESLDDSVRGEGGFGSTGA